MTHTVVVSPTTQTASLVSGHARKFGLQTNALRERLRTDRVSDRTVYSEYGIDFIFIADSTTQSTKVIIHAVVQSHGFICKPRMSGKNRGWTFGATELKELQGNTNIYSMEHNNKTSASMLQDEDNEHRKSYDFQEYGNVDWKGKRVKDEILEGLDIDVDNTPILTWKGPTGRSIPYDFDIAIPGLTSEDISFSELASTRYTCFGSNIYSGGSILNTAVGSELTRPVIEEPEPVTSGNDIPPKVLGCALKYESNAKKQERNEDGDIVWVKKDPFFWLVVMVNNHYAVHTGFFNEIWYTESTNKAPYDAEVDEETGFIKNPFGWRRMALIVDGLEDNATPAGRPNECWFFNQSGTACTQGIYEYTINWPSEWVNSTSPLPKATRIKHGEVGTTGGSIASSSSTGGYSSPVVGAKSSSSVTYTHAGNIQSYSDYSGDIRVSSQVSVSGTNAQEYRTEHFTSLYVATTYKLVQTYDNLGGTIPTWEGDLNKDAPLTFLFGDRSFTSTDQLNMPPTKEKTIDKIDSDLIKKNVTTTLSSSNGFVLNLMNRKRDYSYSSRNFMRNLGGRWIITQLLFELNYNPYFNEIGGNEYRVKEDFSSTDTTLYYLDLRNNLAVYRRVSNSMRWEQASNQALGVRSMYSDPSLPIFIIDDMPIPYVDQLVLQHNGGEELIWQETGQAVSIHSPLFLLMYLDSPRITLPEGSSLTYNGKTYEDVAKLPWYDQYYNKEHDGNVRHFYPYWLELEGSDHRLDQAEAFAENSRALNPELNTFVTDITPVTDPYFKGSVAVNLDGGIFYSVEKDNKSGFINVETNGKTPGQFFAVEVANKNAVNVPMNADPEGSTAQHPDIFYPIAPIQTLPIIGQE